MDAENILSIPSIIRPVDVMRGFRGSKLLPQLISLEASHSIFFLSPSVSTE